MPDRRTVLCPTMRNRESKTPQHRVQIPLRAWLQRDHDLWQHIGPHAEERIVCGRKPKGGPSGNFEVLVVGIGPSCCGKSSAFKDWGRFRDRKSLKFPLPCVGTGVTCKYAQHQQRKQCTRTAPRYSVVEATEQAEPVFISGCLLRVSLTEFPF